MLNTKVKFKSPQPDGTTLTNKISNEREAAYFLKQATLGATYTEIQACAALGSRKLWIEDQFTKTFAKRFVDRVYVDEALGTSWTAGTRLMARNAIYNNFLNTDAVLRAKCVKALTRIFVISSPGGGLDLANSYTQAGWFDRLDSQVFGNYKELLELVSLSYPMSRMLSHFANKKESSTQQPDENYAREIMQLFTIGLWKLNIDGSQVLDGSGNPVPTYTNDDIRQLARVFTGWVKPHHTESAYTTVNTSNDTAMATEWARGTSAGGQSYNIGQEEWTYTNPTYKLRNYLGFYETGAKNCLEGLINIPANTDSLVGLRMALDALVNHPSCAPFVAKRLIGALVSHNPSQGYIARVASIFRNNGSGVVGDMKSVWKAILLDKEAVFPDKAVSNKGRVLDGLEIVCQYLRVLQVKTTENKIVYTGEANVNFGMEFLQEPSIFGWYDLTKQNPELDFWKPTLIADALDRLLFMLPSREPRDTANQSTTTGISDYSMLPISGTVTELIERANLLFCGGVMSEHLRMDLTQLLTSMPNANLSDRHNRATTLLNVVLPSVESRTLI